MAKSGYAFNTARQTFLATSVALANTHWTRMRGLLGQNERSFSAGKGLWIVPCNGVHTIAMKIPLDLVYLNEHMVVQRLVENVKPWRLAPFDVQTASVLELPARTIWTTGTTVGDRIEISFEPRDAGVGA
ncbi:MAG TPA: DUF192 domain-containing protein [Terriglobales bacterium]|nr:DUF192 domain-containing protein [Terriglobales bacterium]